MFIMFIVVGFSGVREELLVFRVGCEVVEVIEVIVMGFIFGLGSKDVLDFRIGFFRSWFSVGGWGWFIWKGLIGVEVVVVFAERVGGVVVRVRIVFMFKCKGWKYIVIGSIGF